MPKEDGFATILILAAIVGILILLAITTLAPIQKGLLSLLYNKSSSFAASSPTYLSFGKMNLSATFNSIGVEVFNSGATSSAQLEFKKSSDSTFQKGLDLWATNDGSTTPGPACFG